MLFSLSEKLSFFGASSSSVSEDILDPAASGGLSRDPAFEAMEEDSEVFQEFDDSKVSEPLKQSKKRGERKKQQKGVIFSN